MLFYILLNLIYGYLDKDATFSFMLSNKKTITLSNPIKYTSNSKFNHLARTKSNEETHGQWYYVHFLEKDISEIQKYISIKSSDKLIKDTFVLFLKQEQIEKISNFSLIKKIEPFEKYFEDRAPSNSDKFTIFTAPNFELPKSNDYIIHYILNGYSIIIRILRKGMNEKDFNEKKKEIIRYLSEIPEIKSISPYIDPVPNNAIISGFTQRNNFNFKLHNKSKFYYLDRYLNDKGLTGENQVITILDDPIDFYHSMFRDDNVQVKLNTYMPNHRKIVYYNFDGNLNDYKNNMKENSHGTHVAGTVSGKSTCINDEKGVNFYNGIAPDSKILYAGSLNNIDPNGIQSLMNQYHSRISSNSWGNNIGFVNIVNYYYGKIAELYPNSTYIFSAGNEYQKMGNFSVCDPGGSKNVLTVGSLNDFYIDDDYINISSKSDPNLWLVAYCIKPMDPWFDGSIGTEPGKSDILVVDLDKGEQCKSFLHNSLFLLYGNDRTWIDNCKFNYSSILIVSDSFLDRLKKLLESKSDVHTSKIFIMDDKKRIGQSYYSSTGPANKGILKPDVMAPGTNIISAKSRAHSNSPHGCRDMNEGDFTIMSGTSMACPNVAGGVALIHQYFQSGNWSNKKVILDGATTRALVINSCKHPLQSKTPDITFGHGTVDLSTIIPIDNDFGVQITHQGENANDQKPAISTLISATATLNVDTKLYNNNNNKDLQITLSYLDPMLNMDSPIPITRDLDLIVSSPSKKIYTGDHLSNGDTQHISTNEKVIIRNNELEDGNYSIYIYANSFTDRLVQSDSAEQKFSVVASGPIKNGYLEFKNSIECPCEKCKPDLHFYCDCNESIEIGPVCQAKIETFTGKEGAFYVGPMEIKRIRIISDKRIKYVYSKSRNPGKDSTIWISPVCHLSLGDYEINGGTNDELSNEVGEETKVNFVSNEVCIAIFNNNYMASNYIIEVSHTSKFKWFYVMFFSMAAIILILFVLVCYLCCCRKKCCCGCCKCCKCCNKDEFATTDSISQFSLTDKLIKY